MRVTTEQALAWRLRRQALDHPADEPVTSVADRMLATRGWPFDAAALSVAIRRIPSDRGALARAADRGDVIRAYFFAAGLSVPGRRMTGWLTDLDDAITSVDVDGLDAYAATADQSELAATQPSSDIRLIPGYDPWVLGPGTADAWVVPRARRADATRGANLILRGGGVIGTWKFARGEIHTNLYPDADPVSTADLNNSTARTLALLTA